MTYDELFYRIEVSMDTFNPALKKIALWVLDNKEDLKYLKIKDISTICGVANSTVMRFINKIGLSSFNDFRIIVSSLSLQTNGKSIEVKYETIEKNDTVETIAKKIEQQYIYSVTNTLNGMDYELVEKAIDLIANAKNIYFFSLGISVSNSYHAASRFLRIGKKCHVINDIADMAMISNHTEEDDIVITVCFSGKTKIYYKVLQNVKKNKTPVILLTGNALSKLNELSDVVLQTQVKKIAEFMVSMSNRISINALLDVLYTGVCLKNFQQSQESIWNISHSIKELLEQ